MIRPLLTTKLHIPEPRSDLVPRSRLMTRIDAGLSGKLTLISAPAGFGKSTLLSSWVKDSKLLGKIAWLTLDENDNEFSRFLIYFIAALQIINDDIGQGIMPAIQSPGVMDIETILTLLINEIAYLPHDVVLVLDDYHVIESQSVDQAIDYILEHLPAHMHLLVGTRSDPSWPLARLRARGQMNEIRANDLRFTLEETAVLLNQVMGIGLSDEQVARLEERTEGWITGLQLAAHSMQSSGDLEGFMRAFTGSNRHILDYLGEEVLANQTEDVQAFLVQTAILDSMTAPLCDAVTGSYNGEQMLETLEKGNLFIIPLDNERRWYRYHHLFRNLLYRRLKYVFPEKEAELHHQASTWYLDEGEIDSAIYHAMAGGKKQQAADILEEHWQEIFVRGELSKLTRLLDSLGPEFTDDNEIFRMAYCMIYSQTGDLDLIPSHSDFIRRKLKARNKNVILSDNQAAIPSLFESMEAILALGNGLANKAKEHARKAISLIPQDASPVDRRRLILSANFRLGQAHRELGELDQACLVLTDVLEDLKATDSFYVINTAAQLISIHQETGNHQEARYLCEETLRFIEEKRWEELPPVGQIFIALADLQVEAGEYEAARKNLAHGRDLAAQQNNPEIQNKLKRVEKKLDDITLLNQTLTEQLTERELEVLQLIAQGLSNSDISDQLFLALSTVKGHNRNIFDKLQVQRRTEAVARARELGLI